jgi:hypothetical protein
VCDNPDQAAHYHTLGINLGASSLTRHFADLGVKVVFKIEDIMYYKDISPSYTQQNSFICSPANGFTQLNNTID